MPRFQRQADVVWEGNLARGHGTIQGGTGALRDLEMTLPTTLFTPVVVAVLALAVTMELWLVVQASPRRYARAFLLPGLGLQRLTTREPTLRETRVALRAVESVLRRELEAA